MQRGGLSYVPLSTRTRLYTLVFSAALVSSGSLALDTSIVHRVSQKGRAFHPGETTLPRGETLQVVNDDGDLLHHAYVDSPEFKFDSGDQEPGSVTEVLFPTAGTFTMLCGIHPKMKLIVHVK